MFVDPEMADGIMAPYALVLKRDGRRCRCSSSLRFANVSSSCIA